MQERDDIVYLSSKVNEIFATTELIQYFTNPLNDPIELTISFPIKEEISLSKFVVSIGDKVIISKVMPKEKAKEKYTDAISSGNVGFFSEYEEDNKVYSVNIGNLKPKEQIKLNTVFIQMIESQDMSYMFNIMEKYPSFYFKGSKKRNNKPKDKIINADFEIRTQSKITRLITPFLDDIEKKFVEYEVKYNSDYTIANIKYIKDPEEEKILYLDKPKKLYSFSILFRTEYMNRPILYTQYNPELKETAYSINYMYVSKNFKNIPVPEKPDEDNNISYATKYEESLDNETPGLFIFLIDQSGSMSGESIKLVKKALLLFIQSLPEKSYFQLIGFGSNFKKYNNEPVVYHKTNVSKIIKIINQLEADLGGTNISGPLKDIYQDKNYSKINLSKNIFLLTDGQVHDREECINLITENSNKFRIHAIGIGNYFDKILIENCGKLGKGSWSFVQNVENINSVVINALNKGLRPYITDIKYEFENYKEDIASNIITCTPINDYSYQNEIINYSFILPGDKELSKLKIKITGKDPIDPIDSVVEMDNILKLDNGEEMSKIIVGKALKYNQELINNEKKEIEFAKKYQILSKNTALFAQILNEDNLRSKLMKVNINYISDITPQIDYNLNKKIRNRAVPKRSARSFLCKKRKLPRKKLCKKISKPKQKARDKKIGSYSCKKINRFLERESLMENRCIEKIREESPDKRQKHDNTNLIMSQDIIEGSWNVNDETKKLINIITLNKFNKIKSKVNALNKGEIAIKIIYTILVIFYLKTKCANQIKEYRLIINKAKKFLKNNGINYDDIVAGI